MCKISWYNSKSWWEIFIQYSIYLCIYTYRAMYILSQHSCSCIWHLNHILLYSHTLQTPDTLWMLQTESSKEVPILLEFYYCLSSHNLQGMEGSAEVLNIDSRYHFDTDCVLYVTIGQAIKIRSVRRSVDKNSVGRAVGWRAVGRSTGSIITYLTGCGSVTTLVYPKWSEAKFVQFYTLGQIAFSRGTFDPPHR